MHLCMLDYVCHDNIDITLNVQEVCREISNAKQLSSKDGKVYTNTPDELFDKLTWSLDSLPDDTAT